MEKVRPLSLTRILWTDYPSFYASLVPLVAWIIYFAWFPDWNSQGPVIKPEAKSVFLTLIILSTLGGLSVLAYRLWLFLKVFRQGIQVRGKITHFELRRDHGRVNYAYIYDQQEYLSSAIVHRTSQTKELRIGEHVMLVVDHSKPSRAFICDLYTR